MAIYFLTYHCKPSDDSVDYGKIGGAYVNCWIEAEDQVAAINISKHKIIEIGWTIIELEEYYIITEKDYLNLPNASGLRYFHQALIDKWVLNIHTYPVEDLE